MSALALRRSFALGLRPALRFCCRVLASVYVRAGVTSRLCPRFAPGDTVLLKCFILGSRLLFDALRQTGRLAISCVSIPPGRDRHSCVLAALVRLSALAGSLRVWPFICGDPDGGTGDTRNEERGPEERGWRRGLCALLRKHIGLVMLSAGSTLGLNVEAALRPPQTAPKSQKWKRHCRLSGLSSRCGGVALARICSAFTLLRNRIGLVVLSAGRTLGLRAPDCAKESSTLWTLFTLRRGCVGAYTRRHPGTRKDPPESNLCSGGSGCIAMLPIRTNVQTRAAPKRRGVGLQRAERCGCGTAAGLRARSGLGAGLSPAGGRRSRDRSGRSPCRRPGNRARA